MNIKDSIKLIGVDLDGTLLRDDKTLCPGAQEVIREAVKKGLYFVPITGRPFSGIPEALRDIGEIEYYICSNGAQIIDAKSGKSIFSFTLDNEQTLKIINLLKGTDYMFEVFTDGVGYINHQLLEHYKNIFTDTPVGDYIFSSRKVVENLASLFENTQRRADEVFIICKSAQHMEELKKLVSQVDDIQCCLLGDRLFEITRYKTDKGNALEALCNYLNIDLKNTIAFGDGENDFQFLKKAGVAVAMKNAVDCIKENADIIAKSNNDNGVCEIIKGLL